MAKRGKSTNDHSRQIPSEPEIPSSLSVTPGNPVSNSNLKHPNGPLPGNQQPGEQSPLRSTSLSSGVSQPQNSAIPATHPICVELTVIYGSLTQVSAPIAVAPRYQGVALAGFASDFDKKLDCWLTRVIEVGIISSVLGQVSLLPLKDLHTQGAVQVQNLFLVGMGEPGAFAEDDLRFLISNVVVGVRALGYSRFTVPLIGSRRKELSLDRAIRGMLRGVQDGEGTFRAMLDGVKFNRERYEQLLSVPFEICVVDDTSSDHIDQITKGFNAVASELESDSYKISVHRGDDRPIEAPPGTAGSDVDPDMPVTILRVTKKAGKPLPIVVKSEDPSSSSGLSLETEIFEFSALGDQAVVTVREQEVSSYFLRELPKRLSEAPSQQTQEMMGQLFLNYLVPDDLRKFVAVAGQLCVVVDKTTAGYPWEMAAYNTHGRTCWMGTELNLSRRFYSVHSTAPGSPPPVNHTLRVLVIADPAPGPLSLSKARDEGMAVVAALNDAQRAWGDQYDIKAWVRIGSYREPDSVGDALEQLRRQTNVVASAEACDPLELLTLIVNRSFDVMHFAGHGMFDEEHDRAGWIFDRGCLLTAREICRVRQVPRLVFANACFSSVTTIRDEQRQQVVGLAQAFFARGIQNYIGTGWTVDDALAAQFANTFYRRVLGLASVADGSTTRIGTAPPATLGQSLAFARTEIQQRGDSTWGAYQHYGTPNDKLLPVPNLPGPSAGNTEGPGDAHRTPPSGSSFSMQAPRLPVEIATSFDPSIPSRGKAIMNAAIDPNKLYVNGINPQTGSYAVPPISIDDLTRQIRDPATLKDSAVLEHAHVRAFAPFDVNLEDLSQAGWGIIFPRNTPAEIRAALQPLIEHRRQQAGPLLKELDYLPNEQLRDWYQRHQIAIGSPDPQLVPYYLLIVGSPESVPFEFQYLLGVEYAVGRIALPSATDYSNYVKSLIDYETAAPKNKKKVVYWGTSHPNDPATNLSSSLLVTPLARGLPDTVGSLSKPVHEIVGFQADVYLEDQATRAQLVQSLSQDAPPALLFTASHGMAYPAGNADQPKGQGGLLCQDWPGFGPVQTKHCFGAADVPDSAKIHGLIAVLFACFSAGTPDRDQFLMNLASPGTGEPPAKNPMMSALPAKLLSHPAGAALAVIGHIDRAWGYSIQPAKSIGAHIGPFRNGLGDILCGKPVGLTLSRQFGQWYSTLSVVLANAISPTAPPNARLDDRTLVTSWIERNDSQNYVLLGDPAVRMRVNEMAAPNQ